MATRLREIEADVKRQAAEEKAERMARRAAREAQAPPEEAGGEERGKEEASTEAPSEALPLSAGAPEPAAPIPPVGPASSRLSPDAAKRAALHAGRVPELPEKFEDFLEIFCRAFLSPRRGRATEGDQVLLGALAKAVWERLHVYEWQIEQEKGRLRRVVEEVGAEAGKSYKDLRARSHRVEIAFKTEPALRDVSARLEAEIEFGINQLLKLRYGSDLEQDVFPPAAPNEGTHDWHLEIGGLRHISEIESSSHRLIGHRETEPLDHRPMTPFRELSNGSMIQWRDGAMAR